LLSCSLIRLELDTLHGRIIIGFLLVEDFFAIVAISAMNTLSNFTFFFLLIAIGKAVLLLLLAFFINKLVVKPLFEYSAKSQEMLFLFALSSCFIFSFLFKYVGQLIIFCIKLVGLPLSASIQAMLEPGFSIAIGAFVAGITLATLPYTFEIIGRIKSLRDFFAVIFFVSLGLEIVPGAIAVILKPLLYLTIIVLVIKPLLTIIICSVFGYTKKTSFMTAATLSQTSEFGLIIVAQGIYTLGHVSSEFFTLTVLLAIITITYTAYLVKYEGKIYRKMRVFLLIFEWFAKKKKHLEYLPEEINNEVLLVGYDRIGYSIFHTLNKLKKNFIIVDFNPEVIKKLIKQKVHCIYGDVADEEILKRLHLSKAKMVISTTPDITTNKILIKKTKQANKSALVFVTAYSVDDALNFYDQGADYVILPHFLGGQHVSLLLEEFSSDFSKLVLTKVRHINELRDRYDLGHDHPKHERQR